MIWFLFFVKNILDEIEEELSGEKNKLNIIESRRE